MDQTDATARQAETDFHLCRHYQLQISDNIGGWPLIHTTPDGKKCLSVVGSEIVILNPNNFVREGACHRQIEAGTCPIGYTIENITLQKTA